MLIHIPYNVNRFLDFFSAALSIAKGFPGFRSRSIAGVHLGKARAHPPATATPPLQSRPCLLGGNCIVFAKIVFSLKTLPDSKSSLKKIHPPTIALMFPCR